MGAQVKAKSERVMSAREGAVSLLNAVLGDGAMLSQIDLPDGMPAQERARAERLASLTLRNIDRADRLLQPHMRKAPPLPVLNILRLAVVELATGGAAHGVVNEAVATMRRGKKTQHMSGLVNAVLRAVGQPPALDELPAPMMPRWLRQPLVHSFGRDAVAAIEAIHAQTAPIDLTPRGPDSLLPEGEPMPNGSLRLHNSVQISALPGYLEGAWWVQDAAASMAADLLGAKDGDEVLDLCAAPGGKTMQLAAKGAKVTALDISAGRMSRVQENLGRTNLVADLMVTDALKWEPEQRFDAILVDAPCSATGTLRRHPDLPFIKDGSEVEGLVALQAEILDRALGWLKPGGRLVFCTCSLLPAEGEDQLTAALARHPDLSVERPTMDFVAPEWITADGGLRLRPDYWADKGGMDGFFMVKFVKA